MFKAEEWIYFAVILLVLIGVGVTDYAPDSSRAYWLFMIAALAAAAVVVEKLQFHLKGIPFIKLLIIQMMHWGATLVAVFISLSLVDTGRLTYEGSGLVVLLLLSLATFLDGVHVGWRFYLAGSILALATIVTAYFEAYLWMMLLAAVVGVILSIYLEKYLASRQTRPDPV